MKYKITVTGLVQGIGFRPFVAELAEELKLTGQVKNLGGIVEIIVSGDKQAVDTFIHRLNFVSDRQLPGCRIDSFDVVEFFEEKNCQEDLFGISKLEQEEKQYCGNCLIFSGVSVVPSSFTLYTHTTTSSLFGSK